MKKHQIRIYVDMDGVCCNFEKGALELFDTPIPDPWPIGLSSHQVIGVQNHIMMERIHSRKAMFWEELEEYPWYRELMGLAKRYGYPYFISGQRRSPMFLMGKAFWIARHYPNKIPVGYILSNKKNAAASPRSILIDDNFEACKDFVFHGGHSILFPQPWNANHDKCDNRLGYVEEELKRFTGVVLANKGEPSEV